MWLFNPSQSPSSCRSLTIATATLVSRESAPRHISQYRAQRSCKPLIDITDSEVANFYNADDLTRDNTVRAHPSYVERRIERCHAGDDARHLDAEGINSASTELDTECSTRVDSKRCRQTMDQEGGKRSIFLGFYRDCWMDGWMDG